MSLFGLNLPRFTPGQRRVSARDLNRQAEAVERASRMRINDSALGQTQLDGIPLVHGGPARPFAVKITGAITLGTYTWHAVTGAAAGTWTDDLTVNDGGTDYAYEANQAVVGAGRVVWLLRDPDTAELRFQLEVCT